MKKFLKSRIFLKQFFSFFLIICMTFATIAFIMLVITQMAQEKQHLSISESYRKEAVSTINRWISGREYSIKAQALYLAYLGKDRLDSPEVKEILDKQLEWNKNFYNIAIIDEKGKVINSKDGKIDSMNLSDRPYFIEGMKGKSSLYGFFKSRKDSVPIMAIAEPIIIDGKPRYLLAGYITLETIKGIVESLNLGNLGHVYLVNSDGMFITDNNYIKAFKTGEEIKDKDKYKLDTVGVNEVIKRNSGTRMYKDFAGHKVFGSYQWLDNLQVGLIVEFTGSQAMKPIDDLMKAVWITAAVVVITGIILAFFLSRKIIMPVNMLISAAGNITEKNYQAPLNIKTNSELDTLVSHFNKMQSAIRYREEQLHKANEELKIQRAEAIEANKLKSQFLANMSHELRTPLNSIIGFTTRVIKKSGDILPRIQLENLVIVKEEAQHLLDLINNLLDYSKIEAGRMELHMECFDLTEVVSEVRSMTKGLSEGKQLKYEQSFFTEGQIPVCSDRIKIKQVLINLLSNAFKYSEKGTIKLAIEKENDFYKLCVIDEGIGIARENIENIFDEFRQVDGSYTRKVGGTGLGLSITKKFVEMLGGKIKVNSTLGEGSCFTVYLPVEGQLGKDMDVVARPALREKPHFRKRIACIDDDSNVLRLYEQYLGEQGFEVITYSGDEDIITDLVKIMPDVVLLDIMMPKRDGWDILAELKSHPQTRRIPVIMISVLSERNLAYKMKADEYLIKPVSQDELVDAINLTTSHKEDLDVLVVDDDINYLNLMG